MLFNRKLRTKLHYLADLEGWEDDTNIEEKLLRARERDRVQKQKTKDYADAKRGGKEKDICPVDQVLVRNERWSSKIMPNYQEEPCEVLERKGSAVIVKGEGGAVKMWNTAHMEKLETVPEHLTYRKEDDSGDLENINLPEVSDRNRINHQTPRLQYHAELNAFGNNQNHSVIMSYIAQPCMVPHLTVIQTPASCVRIADSVSFRAQFE